MMKEINILDLPEDLVVEILSRVPEVSLVRLRSTCKRWKPLIKDGVLAKKHSANAPKQHSLIIMLIDFKVYLVSVDLHKTHKDKVRLTSQFILKDRFLSSSKEVDIRNVFHCDGLLLCTTKDYRLVVWNPCSREFKWIQPRNSYKTLDIYALGKSSCNKYKILKMALTSTSFVEYEIYDFASDSWRVVGKTNDWFIRRSKDRGMSVNGNTYWLASARGILSRDFLLSFDFSTEGFSKVSLPGGHLVGLVISLSVTREDQKLCLLAARGRHVSDIDVWIATKIESTGAASWSKFLSVDISHLDPACPITSGMNFLVDQENKVVVCPAKHGLSEIRLYVLGGDKFKRIQVGKPLRTWLSPFLPHTIAESSRSLLVSYVPTLVQIQQGLEFLK